MNGFFNSRLRYPLFCFLAFMPLLCGCSIHSYVIGEKTKKSIENMKKSQEEATEMVKSINKIVHDQEKIRSARDKYIQAKSQNNACITLLSTEILEGRDLEQNNKDFKDFKICTDTAAQDTKGFLEYGREITTPHNLFALSPALDFLKLLFDGGIAIWKAQKDEKREGRKTLVSYLSKELTWPDWEQIK